MGFPRARLSESAEDGVSGLDAGGVLSVIPPPEFAGARGFTGATGLADTALSPLSLPPPPPQAARRRARAATPHDRCAGVFMDGASRNVVSWRRNVVAPSLDPKPGGAMPRAAGIVCCASICKPARGAGYKSCRLDPTVTGRSAPGVNRLAVSSRPGGRRLMASCPAAAADTVPCGWPRRRPRSRACRLPPGDRRPHRLRGPCR